MCPPFQAKEDQGQPETNDLLPTQIQAILERHDVLMDNTNSKSRSLISLGGSSYCTQLIDEKILKKKVIECIEKLSFYQQRMKVHHPEKHRARLRLVAGLRETLKFAKALRLRGLIVATDIDIHVHYDRTTLLETPLLFLLRECRLHEWPIVFAGNQRELARAWKGRPMQYVTTIGVIQTDGAHEEFLECIQLARGLSDEWEQWFVKRLDYRNSRNESPLWVACHAGFIVCLHRMVLLYGDPRDWSISKRIELLEDPDIINGWTPLLVAVARNQLDCIIWCLEYGCDRLAKDFQGRNIMWLACESQSLEVMDCLLQYGIDFTSPRRIPNFSPEDHHDRGWPTNEDKTELLLDPFGFCIVTGRVEMIKRFLHVNKTHIQLRYQEEQTPLMLACLYDQESIVRLLLSAGHDPFLRDRKDRTVWTIIVQYDRITCLRVLLDMLSSSTRGWSSSNHRRTFFHDLFIQAIQAKAIHSMEYLLERKWVNVHNFKNYLGNFKNLTITSISDHNDDDDEKKEQDNDTNLIEMFRTCQFLPIRGQNKPNEQ